MLQRQGNRHKVLWQCRTLTTMKRMMTVRMQVWPQVVQAKPRISGALLDGSPCGMRALPSPSPSEDVPMLSACDRPFMPQGA